MSEAVQETPFSKVKVDVASQPHIAYTRHEVDKRACHKVKELTKLCSRDVQREMSKLPFLTSVGREGRVAYTGNLHAAQDAHEGN